MRRFIELPKERGEWTELIFMARASEEQLRAAKLWGDSGPYDVGVDFRGWFNRVQVKCTTAQARGGGYICTLRPSGSTPYTTDDVDFFAIYVIPEDVWYIIPAEVGTRQKSNLLLNPRNKKQKYAPYLEAWHLLRDGKRERAANPMESACPSLSAKMHRPNCCGMERLPRMEGESSRCRGRAKTVAPALTAMGCARLQRCIQCYLARTFGDIQETEAESP